MLSLLGDGLGARGGIAQYNRQFLNAAALDPRLEEITIIPRFGSGAGVQSGKLRQVRPIAGKVAWGARVLAETARHRYDVVFCGHLNASPLAAALARRMGALLWLQVHGIEAWQDRGSLIRRALDRSNLVTSVSRHTRHKLLGWSDLDPSKVRVLPNTLDPFPGSADAATASIADLPKGKIILTVGRLSAGERYKGHDRIIEVLPLVLEKVPDAHYLVVGSGDDLPRLRRLADGRRVASRVLFRQHVDDGTLPGYFASADLFAMPSTGEGFGIVFLEAAAMEPRFLPR